MINTGLINYNKPFTLADGSLTTDAALSTTLQNVKDKLGNSSPLQLATNRIALGSGTISGTSLLNFPDAGTTAADGISFGDARLYRSASSTLTMGGPSGTMTFEPNNGGGRINGNPNGIFTIRPAWDIAITHANGGSLTIWSTTTNLTPPALTGSSATSALSISQTWNTTGNPTLIFANVTNTASGATANLIDLQVGGVSQFNVSKGGLTTSRAGFEATAGGLLIASGNAIRWGIQSAIINSGNGIIGLYNTAINDFNRLQFGGTTSSFPSLKRNGTAIQVRLADDSGFTGIEASTITGTQYRLSALNTAPSSASDTGTLGEIRVDANYIYICTATNTWKRVAIATW